MTLAPATARSDTDCVLQLIGQVATSEGCTQRFDHFGDCSQVEWIGAGAYVSPLREVPLLVEHEPDWRVGTVRYLPRSRQDGLLCVAQVEPEPLTSLERRRLPTRYMVPNYSADTDLRDLLSNGDWFLSAGVHCGPAQERHYQHALMSEVSLTPNPANQGTRPVVWARGDTAIAPQMPLRWYSVWEEGKRRIERSRYRVAPELRLEIEDLDKLPAHKETLHRGAQRPPAAAKAAPRIDRAAAARVAAAAGVGSYGWTDQQGVYHGVRSGWVD